MPPVPRPVKTPAPHRFVSALLASSVLVATACASPAPPDGADEPAPARVAPADVATALTEMMEGGAVDLHDLTHPLSPDSLYWPSGTPFVHEELARGINEAGYWYAAAAFQSPEHLGTHLDAPIHFGEGRWHSAEIPIERFFGLGAVIDISARADGDADATLQPEDITAWEGRNGPLPSAAIVIVRSGWATRWPDWNAYYGSETPNDVTTLHFPGVSEAAARLLVERDVAGIGIDTASIDPGNSATFEAHRVLAVENIYNLENLTNVDGLPEAGFGVIALPMKIAEGTGGPARVVAVVPR